MLFLDPKSIHLRAFFSNDDEYANFYLMPIFDSNNNNFVINGSMEHDGYGDSNHLLYLENRSDVTASSYANINERKHDADLMEFRRNGAGLNLGKGGGSKSGQNLFRSKNKR